MEGRAVCVLLGQESIGLPAVAAGITDRIWELSELL